MILRKEIPIRNDIKILKRYFFLFLVSYDLPNIDCKRIIQSLIFVSPSSLPFSLAVHSCLARTESQVNSHAGSHSNIPWKANKSNMWYFYLQGPYALFNLQKAFSPSLLLHFSNIFLSFFLYLQHFNEY